ncbi:hypothetical protein [Hathewaya massiliensis]|uniref:hypothetical protein n=1 Tax=Hathewaya massiliensis TaxID=1964382 RepID=UPI00115A975E|nr:hypothetical protein [Hathewaya massiliensis]
MAQKTSGIISKVNSKLSKDASNIASKVPKETSTISTAFSGLTGKIAAFASAIGAAKVGHLMINQAADMEAYRNTLNVVMKDSKKAGKMFAWATDFANKTPFETDDVVQATVRLQSYGLEAQKLIPTIGDMASVMNTDLMQAVEAVADAQTGETERLKSFGITKDMIADQGKKMGFEVINKKGQITDLNKFNAVLQNVMKTRFGGGMEKQAKTFKGAMSTVSGVAKNALAQIAGVAANGDIIKGSLFDYLTKGAIKLGNVLQDLSGSGILASIGSTIGKGLNVVVGIGAKAFSSIYKIIGSLGKGSSLMQAFFPNPSEINGKLKKIMGLIQIGVSTAKTIGNSMFSVIQSIITNGGKLIEKISPYVSQFVVSIGDGLQTVLPYVSTAFSSICSGIVKLQPIIVELVAFISSKVFPMLSQVVTFISTYILPPILSFISNVIPFLVQAIQTIARVFEAILFVVLSKLGAKIAYIEQIVLVAVTTITTVLQGIIQAISGVLQFIEGVFTANWSSAWEGVVNIFGGIFGGIVGLIKAPLNAVIGLINSAIGGINAISIDVPDWVPGLGGKHFGMNIPQIPMLAKGGFTSIPSICGEAGPEAVIPLKRNNPRSIQLLAETSRRLGLGNLKADTLSSRKAENLSGFKTLKSAGNDKNSNKHITINYSPKFEGVDKHTKEEIQDQEKSSFEEFKEYIKRFLDEEDRLQFE